MKKLDFIKDHPVSFVQWINVELVHANDYNPNKVAPPEMELLELSIKKDGFTQPIVTWKNGNKYEVVDGFHRHLVGKKLGLTHLPVVVINKKNESKGDRISSTIRHNRARGKHVISAMSEIVIELKNRNWTNKRISKELGMDEEEILRLCQITGLEEIFKDEDFSKSWNIEDSEEDFEQMTDEVTEEEKEINGFRTINTSDESRIFHTYDKWECYKSGFYNTTKEGMTKEECELEYARFLSSDNEFKNALDHIIKEWKHSCEHYLTNKAMNRIAWLGQAALCYAKGIPSCFRGGWNLLSKEDQDKANNIAFEYLNKWLKNNGYNEISFEEAISIGRQVEIY